MTNTARTAADTGLPEDTRPDWSRTMEGRIAQWCAWFDAPQPDPSWRAGGEDAEGVLLDWCSDAGASIDWVLRADPRGMAQLWRERELELQRFKTEIGRLDAAQMRVLAGVGWLLLEDLVAPEDIPELVRQTLEKHRVEREASVEREA